MPDPIQEFRNAATAKGLTIGDDGDNVIINNVFKDPEEGKRAAEAVKGDLNASVPGIATVDAAGNLKVSKNKIATLADAVRDARFDYMKDKLDKDTTIAEFKDAATAKGATIEDGGANLIIKNIFK